MTARKQKPELDVDAADEASDKPLTGKQAAFVKEYAICLNGTHAARLSGHEGNDASLAATASRLLRNVKVRKALDIELERHGAMPKNEVLMHITDIARGDIADVMNPLGGIDPSEAIRRGKSHLVKRFKVKTTTIDSGAKNGAGDKEIIETEIEMYSREWALGQLAKFYDLTNKVRLDDWRSQAVRDIADGIIEYAALAEAFDESLATELFRAAGVPISAGKGT